MAFHLSHANLREKSWTLFWQRDPEAPSPLAPSFHWAEGSAPSWMAALRPFPLRCMFFALSMQGRSPRRDLLIPRPQLGRHSPPPTAEAPQDSIPGGGK